MGNDNVDIQAIIKVLNVGIYFDFKRVLLKNSTLLPWEDEFIYCVSKVNDSISSTLFLWLLSKVLLIKMMSALGALSDLYIFKHFEFMPEILQSLTTKDCFGSATGDVG